MHNSATLKLRKSFILLFSHHLLCSDKLKCFKLKGPFSRALFYRQHRLSKLTRQMEPFAIAIHVGKAFGKGRPFQIKLER